MTNLILEKDILITTCKLAVGFFGNLLFMDSLRIWVQFVFGTGKIIIAKP